MGLKTLQSKSLAWALVVLMLFGLLSACGSGNPAPSGGSGSDAAGGSTGGQTESGASPGAEQSGGQAGCKDAPELVVSAAVSLKDALTEYQPAFEARECVKLRFNFGASGQLMQQIEQGAPADVFVSAGAKQVDELEQKGLIDPATRVDVVKNALVMAVKKGTPEDQKLTFERLKSDQKAKLAIGEPKSVPAGTYAKEVLDHLGVYEEMEKAKRLVFGTDVRQVLAYVETGEVDGGLVYRTDAAISDRVEVSDTADPSWHRPIVYPGAVVKGSRHPDKAQALLRALALGDGQEVLRRYGFEPATK